MDRDTLWGHIHHERDALAATLRTLTPEQWEHDSLCDGLDRQGRRRPRHLDAADGLRPDDGPSSRATSAAATTR